ncbi:hypothetical protein GCM10007094_39060 [Pseudovibrio japonicus]|uniref:Uncharacterized protein n=1 Tax=Pseudovibrio japonicus TaxID=366534 RepID=A0ABQ3EM17_9HYPH|nr:hypothetical protein GCM10007094_39060 [Pseudovibrio japonicus]
MGHYYIGSKEILEVIKKRLARDTARQANTSEFKQLAETILYDIYKESKYKIGS